jgi:2'-hydroxyisoflavone reductase
LKKALVLGGTQFIGRNLVERLLKEGLFEVTLFNRSQTGVELFPEAKRITGDRETSSINQISDEDWDVVIDLSCYYPAALESTLRSLSGSMRKYIFISTVSAYDLTASETRLRDEDAITMTCDEQERVDRSSDSYGARKAECERILQASAIDFVILRPSLVYGQYDHTDRLYYWLHQVKCGNLLLLPGNGERVFSMTYVKDLVEVIMQSMHTELPDRVYNVMSNLETSIGEIVTCTMDLMGASCDSVHAPAKFLHDHNVKQWTDMPLWLDTDYDTFSNLRLTQDFSINLTELETSIGYTIDYYHTLGWSEPTYGMSESIRLDLLEKLAANKSTSAAADPQ